LFSIVLALLIAFSFVSTAFAGGEKLPTYSWDYTYGCNHYVGWENVSKNQLVGTWDTGKFQYAGTNHWETRDACNGDVLLQQGSAKYSILGVYKNGQTQVYRMISESSDGLNVTRNVYGVVGNQIKIMQIWVDKVLVWTQH